MSTSKSVWLLALVLLVGRSLSAGENPRYPARAKTYVPIEHWAYGAVDRLGSWGYVQTQFLGLRPWTRLEFARLTAEAGEQLAQGEAAQSQAPTFYQALADEFAGELEELRGARRHEIRLESVYLRTMEIEGEALRDGYHFGQTVFNDYGRPFGEGSNINAGFTARASAGPFAAYFRGEYQHSPCFPALPQMTREILAYEDGTPLQPETTFAHVNRFRPVEAYVSWNIRNLQFSFGKQSLWWGPGKGGTTMFTNNAEPLPMVRITRVVPTKLPRLFSWMGPVRSEFFFGQLRGHHHLFGRLYDPLRPQPYIHGQKFSFKPTSDLEFGFSRTVVFGGEGAPLTWGSFWHSSFSIGNAPGTIDPGDRRSSFDFAYRIPGLRKWLLLYNDSFTEDEYSPIAYPRRSAMNPGIYMPQVPGVPKLDIRFEAAYTDLPELRNRGSFYSNNAHYTDGYTNYGYLLAHWVGRQGRGLQLWSTYHLRPQSTIELYARQARVSQDFLPGGGSLTDIAGRSELMDHRGIQIAMFVQYESWRFPALATRRQANVTTSVQLTYWLPGAK